MPKGGLEPPRVAPYAPQTYVSTNSTTSARGKTIIELVSQLALPPELHSPPEKEPAWESVDSPGRHH